MYLNILNSGVGVSLLLKFNPVVAECKTSKRGSGFFLELHPVTKKNRQMIKAVKTKFRRCNIIAGRLKFICF